MTLLELMGLLRKHLKLVIALPVVCAILCGVATMFMADEYTATTTMYVLTNTFSDSESISTQSSDLSASQMIANDVATLAESDSVKADVAVSIGMEDLDDYEVEVESSTDTRIITLSVTGTDPQTTASVANAFVQNVSSTASSVMDVEAVNLIDQAQTPETPSGPQRALYVIVAFLAGLFIAIAAVVIADMVNIKVRNDDDVDELLDLPVVGHFPKMD